MPIKQSLYKPKGMNKDLSYSAFNPEYSWHNKNIRLTARDGNDLLSVTNERGNVSLTHTEYFRDIYSYVATYYGYVDVMEPPTFHYVPTYSNYQNILVPPTYHYVASYSDYFDTLISLTGHYVASYSNYSDTLINV